MNLRVWGAVAMALGGLLAICEVWGTYEFLMKDQRVLNYLVVGGCGVAAGASVLPALASRAWGQVRLLSVALWLAYPLALVVVFAAAVERLGDAKDVAQSDRDRITRQIGLAEQAAETAKKTYEEDEKAARDECKSGRGSKCLGLEARANASKIAYEQAQRKILDAGIEKPDPLASRIAALLLLRWPDITEKHVRLYQPLFLPLVLSVLACLFLIAGERLLFHRAAIPRPTRLSRFRAWFRRSPMPEIMPPYEPDPAIKEAPCEPSPLPVMVKQKPRLLSDLEPTASSNVVRLVTDQSNGSVGKFLVQCTDTHDGAVVELNELYDSYLGWCDRERSRPLAPADFLKALEAICDRTGYSVRRRAGKVCVAGLKLAA
jgi:hypothetical protein